MSIEYFASFSPVCMSIEELAYEVSQVVFELGASVDVDFDRLDIEESHYIPSHEYIENDSLIKAIQMTKHWPGIQLHLDYESRQCDITLIKDIPNNRTLIFSESKSLYKQQIQGETELTLLETLLVFFKVFQFSYCVFEPGWVKRSRVLSDIEEWIKDLNEGRMRDWAFVIVQESIIPFSSIPNKIKTEHVFKCIEGLDLWYFSLE